MYQLHACATDISNSSLPRVRQLWVATYLLHIAPRPNVVLLDRDLVTLEAILGWGESAKWLKIPDHQLVFERFCRYLRPIGLQRRLASRGFVFRGFFLLIQMGKLPPALMLLNEQAHKRSWRHWETTLLTSAPLIFDHFFPFFSWSQRIPVTGSSPGWRELRVVAVGCLPTSPTLKPTKGGGKTV